MTQLQPLAGFGPAAPGPVEVELAPAKINDRFIAYVIDAAPFAAAYAGAIIYMILQGQVALEPGAGNPRLGAACFGLYLAYQFLGNALGATVGKWLMGLRVVRRDGQPLGVVRAAARALGYVLSTPFFNLGFVIALFHPESRALHDILSGSLVVEGRPKNRAEGLVLFLGAMGLVCSLYGGMFYLNLTSPTRADVLAVEKAWEGLKVMSQIEEAYKARHGAYTASLGELAQESGDAEQFRSAMGEIFEPNLFKVQAGNKGYRISGAALDRKRTRVAIQGPPARLVR